MSLASAEMMNRMPSNTLSAYLNPGFIMSYNYELLQKEGDLPITPRLIFFSLLEELRKAF
jgi:hypothetical protein